MSNFATASRSIEFELLLARCDGNLVEKFKGLGVDKPAIFSQLVRHPAGSDEAREGFSSLLQGLQIDPDLVSDWSTQCMRLHAVALDATPAVHARVASLTGFQQSADIDEHRRSGHRAREQQDLNRLALHSLAHLPTEWRGKRYRRTQGQATEHARAEGETKERLRKGRQVAGILVEANLPFATSLSKAAAVDDTTVLRCCRGMRSKTLEQRVACWRPFRRYLLTQGLGPWPREPEHLLGYFELKVEEGLARTTLPSLVSSLRFLEEAGELPEELRLSAHPAVRNAVREHSLTAEEQAQQASTAKPRKQAPPLLLFLIGELELVVRDEDRPLYHRAFAWYRLFRHWASLRWDDTQALLPSSLERRARGVFGLLERTKTSGPGKTLTVLPCFVSESAYVRKPWLDVGLLLWSESPLDFPRDYFLPLPSVNFQGCLQQRALYSDSAGFSRALLGTLRRPDGTALLSAAACRFWTEHSDRAGLDGWCMALAVPEPERSFLGRWAAKGSTDAYVRTAVRVVENLQLLAARHAQASAEGGPDFYGEEHILRDFRRYLREAGEDEARIELIMRVFSLPDFSLRPVPLEDVRAAVKAAADVPPSPTLLAKSDVEADEDEDDDDEENEAEPEMESHELEPAEVKKAAAAVAAAAPPVPRGFVVSRTKNGRFRRLHCVEACRLVPGVHYKVFDVWGDIMPPEDELDAVCTRCLPQGPPAASVPPLEEDSSDASSSSSSSRESVGAQAKKPRISIPDGAGS